MGLRRIARKIHRMVKDPIKMSVGGMVPFYTSTGDATKKGGLIRAVGRAVGGKKGERLVENLGREGENWSTTRGWGRVARSMKGVNKEEKQTQQAVAAQEAASAEEMMRRYRRRSQQSLRTSGMG